MKKLLLILVALSVLVVSAYTATVRVYERGTGEVTVAASEKIAVFTRGTAKVYYKVGSPNIPGAYKLLATVQNREYLSSAFSTATAVKIEADAQGAWYSTDATPDIQWSGPTVQMKSQEAPIAKTTAATLTVQELMSGLITGDDTDGSTVAYTLPLGTSMDNSSDASFAIGDSFDWVLINLSDDETADTFTVTANTGHTIVGNAVVNADATADNNLWNNSSGQFRTRKTAAATFITYRIN